jgi:hypothetical protein
MVISNYRCGVCKGIPCSCGAQYSAEWTKAERDKAMAKVTVNAGPWKDIAKAALDHLPPDARMTGEDIRLYMMRHLGVPPPHHHNAWGPLIKSGINKGLLVQIDWQTTKTRISHARNTPVYQVKTVHPWDRQKSVMLNG